MRGAIQVEALNRLLWIEQNSSGAPVANRTRWPGVVIQDVRQRERVILATGDLAGKLEQEDLWESFLCHHIFAN